MIAFRAITHRSGTVFGRLGQCLPRTGVSGSANAGNHGVLAQPFPLVGGVWSSSSSSSSSISTTTRLQFRTSMYSRRSITAEGAQNVTAKTKPIEKTSTWTWSRIAFYVKAVRVPFLVVAIYGLGYRQGIADTVRNPLKLQQGTFETLLLEMGVSEEDDVEIVSERRIRGFSTLEWFMGQTQTARTKPQDPRTEKIATIGSEIIQVARRYVRQQLGDAVEKAKEKYKGSFIKDEVLARKLNAEPTVEFWVQALERIEGASLEGIDNWQYVLVDTPVPNAFVSEMLPQRFFVTTGLFKEFVDNDDELAMVLGHEISHLILGHLSQSSMLESFLRGLEIVILMLDPTDGLLSLGLASFLASSRDAVMAAQSRQNETEADELGCKLAGMACFDTKRGVEAFRKMAETDERMVGSYSKLSMMNSHPPSAARYEVLRSLSDTENYQQYSYCNTLGRRIKRALAKK